MNYCIRQIRVALEDSAENARFVATVPRRGYRFLPKTTVVDATLASAGSAEEGQLSPEPPTKNAKTSERVIPQRLPLLALWLWVGSALTVGALLGITLIWRHHHRVHSAGAGAIEHLAPQSRKSIAVLEFANLSNKSEDLWLATALPQMFTSELAEGGRLRVVSQDEIAKAGAGVIGGRMLPPKDLEKLRHALSADLLLVGSYAVVRADGSDQLRLDLRIQGDAQTGPPSVYLTQAGDENKLLDIVSGTGERLRKLIGSAPLSAAEIAEANRLSPQSERANQLYAAGLEHMRRFDVQAARDSLEQVTQEEPHFAPAWAALADVLAQLGYEALAREHAERADTLSGGLPREQQLSIHARIYELSSDHQSAIRTLSTLYHFYPDSLDYGLRLANVQMQGDRGTDALHTLGELRQLPGSLGDSPRIDVLEAQLRAHDGDFAKVLPLTERAIAKSRSLGLNLLAAQAWLLRASALERLGRPDESLIASAEGRQIDAEANYQRGVAISELTSGDVLYNRGNFNGARHTYEDASAILREIGDQKNFGLALERIGNTYHDQGQFAESRSAYARALEIYNVINWKTGIASALGNLANVLDASGDLQGSLKMHRDALAVFHETGQKRGEGSEEDNLASVEVEAGDLDAAERDYRRGYEIHAQINYGKGQLFALNGLGDILYLRGDLNGARKQDEAAQELARAAQQNNDVARIDVSLALIDFQQGKLQEAEQKLRQSVDRLKTDEDHEDGAVANAWLARTLLAEQRPAEAASALQQSQNLAAKITAAPQQFEVELAAAQLDKVAGRRDAAKRKLQAVLTRARSGYLVYELQAQLALAELQTGSSRQAQLAAVARRATQLKLFLLADEAKQADSRTLS